MRHLLHAVAGRARGVRREEIRLPADEQPRVRCHPLGAIVPGATTTHPGALNLSGLRELLERWMAADRIVPLSPDLLPPRIWLRQRTGAPRVLAFVGGHANHCLYAAEMVSALGLPAHLFVPCDRIGRPGHATLAQLRRAARLPGIRLEVDLRYECPASSWRRIELLRRAAETLSGGSTRRPRYVWWGGAPLDARARLVLQQSGYAALICDASVARDLRGRIPLIPISTPSRPHAAGARRHGA
ncbi:MAG: hypothetical protein GF330_05535 [Candidatus Eisenbacteria bacterium]|nr:hypothetical protein [Candidatus Eisenbacteria bacterium]